MTGFGTDRRAMGLAAAQDALLSPDGFFAIETADVRGVPMRVWKHAPADVRALFQRARGFGAREALISGNERVSYEAFSRAALAVSAELIRLGVKKGDRVALAMRNVPEWPVVFFGIGLVGGIAVSLNAWWTADELATGLKDCGASVAFFDGARFARVQDQLPSCLQLRQVLVCRALAALPSNIIRLEDAIGAPADWSALPEGALPSVALSPDDDLWIFYTSGTTARPRGVVGSHRNMLSSILAMGYALARENAREGRLVPGGDFLNRPQRAVLLTIPLFHVTGCFAVMTPSLYIGAKLVLMEKWEAPDACRLVERERIAQVWGVPATIEALLDCAAHGPYDMSSLRIVAHGGAPFSPNLAARVRARLPLVSAACGWGMTELSAICTSHCGREYDDHPDSCGLAAPVSELMLMRRDGSGAVGAGEIGEVWARGPNVARGYWNRPEESAQVFLDGWVRTGDLARRDSDGFLTIVDRVKDILNRGGENISCAEVEHILCEHPAVCEAAVVGIENRLLGEVPGAVVRLRDGLAASEKELRDFLARRLAAFKVPERIAFWQKPLPRNAGGKLLRNLLKPVFGSSHRQPDPPPGV